MILNKLRSNLKIFFDLFIAPPKQWSLPRKCEVLIYDAVGTDYLMPYLANNSVAILPLRGESVCVPCLLRAMWSFNFWKGRPIRAYSDAFIRSVSPVIVLTFVDNSREVYFLKARHPRVKFLSIQNAVRDDLRNVFAPATQELSKESLKVDCIMVFGRLFGEQYLKYSDSKVVPIGSLRSNLVPIQQPKNWGTLAFISQYRDVNRLDMGGVFYSFQQFWEQTDQLILLFLAKYAKAWGKTFYIVPCTGHYKDPALLEKEKRYYNQLVGSECAYSEWQWHGSSYDAIDSAEVVVSIDSSLGLEAAVRGTKTAVFSIRSQVLSLADSPFFNFGWPGCYPNEGPFWTNRPDPASFERILDHLFSISEEQWRTELREQRIDDLIEYDPGNSILRRILQSELGPGRDH